MVDWIAICYYLLTACQKDMPEPETKEFASHHNEVIQVSGLVMSQVITFW